MGAIRDHRITIAAAIAVAMGCLAVQQELCGAEFYVAPGGKDSSPGTKEQPLATLEAARDAARKAEAGPHRIVLMPGEHFHDKPFELDARDNGLTIEAGAGGPVTLHGGRRITGLERDARGLGTVRVPEVQGRPWRFEQLYVNGRRAVRARTPNRFYFYMNAPRRASVDPATGQPRKPDDRTFLANAEDIAPLVALPPERLRDVVVASYHSWHISRQIHGLGRAAEEHGLPDRVVRGPVLHVHAERTLFLGKLPRGFGCARRVVPRSRRLAVLPAAAGRRSAHKAA